MIALMMMGSVAIYITILFIALWLIPKVVHHKHIKKMIFIVWFLIPTWDVIIGYPIYKFLCATQAGVKIYKTVDNVEGFYVGEQSKKFEPREPYEGYRFIDYKEKKSGKYYRSYWVDNNSSDDCVPIGDDKWTHNGELYSKLVQSGKCIVKEEIDEGEVSQWEVKNGKWDTFRTLIPIVSIKRGTLIEIKERVTQKGYGEIVDYQWKAGWIAGYIFTGWSVDFEPQGVHSTYDPYKNSEMKEDFIKNTLKPKKGN